MYMSFYILLQVLQIYLSPLVLICIIIAIFSIGKNYPNRKLYKYYIPPFLIILIISIIGWLCEKAKEPLLSYSQWGSIILVLVEIVYCIFLFLEFKRVRVFTFFYGLFICSFSFFTFFLASMLITNDWM